MLDRKGQEGKRSLQKELGHSEQSVEKDPRDQQVDYSLRIVYSSVPMEWYLRGLTSDAKTHLLQVPDEKVCGPEQRLWQDWDWGEMKSIGGGWALLIAHGDSNTWRMCPSHQPFCYSEVIKMLSKDICFKTPSLCFTQYRENLIFSR